MSARQRSKTGCWTCRLRKKKCIEDGPPCNNCLEFGVLCHGYGPRPTWKDRGDLEKEEASKLRLHAKKRRTVSVSSIGSLESTAPTSSATEVAGIPCSATQTDMAVSCSPPQAGADTDFGYFTESGFEGITSDFSFSFDTDFWINEPSYNLAPLLPILPPQTLSNLPDANHAGLVPVPNQSHFGIKASESDITLLMAFLETSFGRRYLLHDYPSTPQKNWLLCLLLRSPTFFNASLSMSAYFSHLNASADTDSRNLAFDKYRRHRNLATRCFDSMSLSPPGVHGEAVVCGVHLALLEVGATQQHRLTPDDEANMSLQALGNNMQSCQSYLSGVSEFLAEEESFLGSTLEFLRLVQFKGRSNHFRINQESFSNPYNASSLPLPSSMESTAAVYFTATFVWNDILCAAAETRIPNAQTKYRLLLAEGAFSSVLREITGCDAWALGSIMDITALEISKRDQLSDGTLRVRDLVHRACKIEAALEHEVRKLPSHSSSLSDCSSESDYNQPSSDHTIRARVFGHAALIYLNTVVSGALTGVPEIHQNICQILPSWEMLSAAANFKYLAWAYSTTASLALHSQRPVFQAIMTNLSLLDAGTGILRGCRSGVEECWKEADRHAPNTSSVPCDWREVYKKANLSFIFV